MASTPTVITMTAAMPDDLGVAFGEGFHCEPPVAAPLTACRSWPRLDAASGSRPTPRGSRRSTSSRTWSRSRSSRRGDTRQRGRERRAPADPGAGRRIAGLVVGTDRLSGEAGVDGLDGEPLPPLGDLDVRGQTRPQAGEAVRQVLLVVLHVGRNGLQVVDGAGDGVVIVPDQPGQVGRHLREVADHVIEQRILRCQGR